MGTIARIDGTKGEGRALRCGRASIARRRVHCKLGEGAYEIELFASTSEVGLYEYVGSLLANSR